jgi:hypothetical protein
LKENDHGFRSIPSRLTVDASISYGSSHATKIARVIFRADCCGAQKLTMRRSKAGFVFDIRFDRFADSAALPARDRPS